jgi:hypothetical protein
LPWVSNADEVLGAIETFVRTERLEMPDRVLATVVLIRLDESPDNGDRAESLIRENAAKFRADRIEALTEGTAVTFDGPTRALECAVSMSGGLHEAGLVARIGIHTGEIDSKTGARGTMAARIAADVCDKAGEGEVLLSRTVRDLVAGSGVSLRERGKLLLPALGEEWRLFEAIDDESA